MPPARVARGVAVRPDERSGGREQQHDAARRLERHEVAADRRRGLAEDRDADVAARGIGDAHRKPGGRHRRRRLHTWRLARTVSVRAVGQGTEEHDATSGATGGLGDVRRRARRRGRRRRRSVTRRHRRPPNRRPTAPPTTVDDTTRDDARRNDGAGTTAARHDRAGHGRAGHDRARAVADAPVALADPSLTVTPSTDLVHLQSVTISGSGFTPNVPVGFAECKNNNSGDAGDCDTTHTGFANADGSGAFERAVRGPPPPAHAERRRRLRGRTRYVQHRCRQDHRLRGARGRAAHVRSRRAAATAAHAPRGAVDRSRRGRLGCALRRRVPPELPGGGRPVQPSHPGDLLVDRCSASRPTAPAASSRWCRCAAWWPPRRSERPTAPTRRARASSAPCRSPTTTARRTSPRFDPNGPLPATHVTISPDRGLAPLPVRHHRRVRFPRRIVRADRRLQVRRTRTTTAATERWVCTHRSSRDVLDAR